MDRWHWGKFFIHRRAKPPGTPASKCCLYQSALAGTGHPKVALTKAPWPVLAPAPKPQCSAQAGPYAVVGKKHPAPKNLRSKDAGLVTTQASNYGPLEAGDAFRGDNAANRAVKLSSG